MIYVDHAMVHGKWNHLTADSVGELHTFAIAMNWPTSWFHEGARFPHYDITGAQRRDALAKGAQAVTTRVLITAAKAARG